MLLDSRAGARLGSRPPYMAPGAQHSRTVPVPDDIRGYVAALVREVGPRRAAARVQLSRHAVLAVALGSPVMPGTLALVREAMTVRAA